MTKEDRELLLKDLCARLPYGVIGVTNEGNQTPLLVRGEAEWDIVTSINYRIEKFGWRPYLRPMSSMTEEERLEYMNITHAQNWLIIGEADKYFDWLNAHHFDYRGLIGKGMALPAKENMYND